MRSKLEILIVILVIFSCLAIGQAPDTLWTKTFVGDGWDYGSWLTLTKQDGFIVVGCTTPDPSDGLTDIYIVETSLSGNTLWERTYGGDLGDKGRHISNTSDGGYIVVGETESFGGGEFERADIYLFKIDSNGNEIWSQTFGGDGWDAGFWVERTSDEGYILTGMLDNSADLVVIKTDSLGNLLWQRTYGTGTSTGKCIRQTDDDGYIICGSDYGNPGPYYGGYLLKIDSLGNEQWSRHYNENNGKSIECLEEIDDGYIMTGFTGSSRNFDIFLKKVSFDGMPLWTKYYAVGVWDRAWSVQQTYDNGFVIGGSSNGYSISNYEDVYIIKTDPDGETMWEKTLGGDYQDVARCVKQTSDGGYIVCGFTTIDYSVNDNDIWLIRLNQEGTSVEENIRALPDDYLLVKAFPNPFNANTTIRYTLNVSSQVKVDIYDILGNKVGGFYENMVSPGIHDIHWDASEVSSGMYFYNVETSEAKVSGKVTLMK